MITEKTITDFLSEEYKEFAMYTIENRAIPSVIDGLKVSTRKVIHTSTKIWKTGNEKTLKVFQLSGKVASDCYYHHGDQSLNSSIINLAQKFKNNYPLLEEEGQFGSLRSPQAGAPRYIGVRLSENFKHIFKDFELLKYKEEEGDKIEPEFFLPIIPTILLNGSNGIAVGFKSNILNRSIISLIDSCQKVLNGKNIKVIKPDLNGFKGKFIQDNENPKKWIIRGDFERINKTTLKIKELPPSMTYEKYEEILDKLIDDKHIVSYDDNCKDDVNYTIKINKSQLESLTDDDIIKLLKLEEYSTEIYSTLDEMGKLKIFDSVDEIIKYFINFRLNYYNKRKSFLLDKMNKDLKLLSNKGRFIKAILDEKLKVNNTPKLEIIKGIELLKLEKIDDSYDYLLRMPIFSLTKEMYEKLKEDFISKKVEIKKIEETDPKNMYLSDLSELSKKFK